MKKFLLSIATVLLFCLCFTFFANASEQVTTETENIEATETVETENNTSTNTETIEPSTPEESTSELVEYAINLATSSAFWTTVAGVLSALAGLVVFVVKIFNSLKTLIKSKADTKTVVSAIQDGNKELEDKLTNTIKTLNDNLQNVKAELEIEKENSKVLSTIVTSFILNTKIGTSAKGEILKFATGLKTYTGTAIEMIEQLNQSIEVAKAEEEKIDTPALDEVMSLSLN